MQRYVRRKTLTSTFTAICKRSTHTHTRDTTIQIIMPKRKLENATHSISKKPKHIIPIDIVIQKMPIIALKHQHISGVLTMTKSLTDTIDNNDIKKIESIIDINTNRVNTIVMEAPHAGVQNHALRNGGTIKHELVSGLAQLSKTDQLDVWQKYIYQLDPRESGWLWTCAVSKFIILNEIDNMDKSDKQLLLDKHMELIPSNSVPFFAPTDIFWQNLCNLFYEEMAMSDLVKRMKRLLSKEEWRYRALQTLKVLANNLYSKPVIDAQSVNDMKPFADCIVCMKKCDVSSLTQKELKSYSSILKYICVVGERSENGNGLLVDMVKSCVM
eukprot:347713_1